MDLRSRKRYDRLAGVVLPVLALAACDSTSEGPQGPEPNLAPDTSVEILERSNVAVQLGADRIDLRRRNLLRNGQSTPTGQVIDDGVDRTEVMDTALELARYDEKRRAHATFNATDRARSRSKRRRFNNRSRFNS